MIRPGYCHLRSEGVTLETQSHTIQVNTAVENMVRWQIVEARSGAKAAEMDESVVEAAGGGTTSGWLIHVERDVTLDPRVPAFLGDHARHLPTTGWPP